MLTLYFTIFRVIRGRKMDQGMRREKGISWNWDYLQILPKKTNEMLILENYKMLLVFPLFFLSMRCYFQVLGTVTKTISAPNFSGLSFLRQYIPTISNGKFGPMLLKFF